MALPGSGLLALLLAGRRAHSGGGSPIGGGPPPGAGLGYRGQFGGQTLAGTRHQIAWGGQDFGSIHDVVAWINAHGGNTNVGQFLANHPGLAAQFGQRGASPGGSALGGVPGAGVAPLAGGLPGTTGSPPPGAIYNQGAPPAFQGGPAHLGASYPTAGLLGGLPGVSPQRRSVFGPRRSALPQLLAARRGY